MGTEEQLKNIKKNWDDSSFLYHNTGSFHSGGGGHRSSNLGVGRVTFAFIVVMLVVMLYMDNSYKKDMYSTNLYLQELEKVEKVDLEKKGKGELKVSDNK